ncbi:MAG: tRNA (adenosine(37)-N6)-threonylcarbamoyltransferase complex ATPase subunit type 1 TsaE [Candidatus Saccharimonadales bacterium]
MTYEITTTNSEATKLAAQSLSRYLSGGEVIELTSDLGGGKTTFVQGLAAGLAYEGQVTSPTFTLSNSYRLEGGLELHHYDLYRLSEGGVLGDELAEDLADPQVITVIEWPAVAGARLPEDHLTINIEVTGDTDRRLTFTSGGARSAKVIEELNA